MLKRFWRWFFGRRRDRPRQEIVPLRAPVEGEVVTTSQLRRELADVRGDAVTLTSEGTFFEKSDCKGTFTPEPAQPVYWLVDI